MFLCLQAEEHLSSPFFNLPLFPFKAFASLPVIAHCNANPLISIINHAYFQLCRVTKFIKNQTCLFNLSGTLFIISSRFGML